MLNGGEAIENGNNVDVADLADTSGDIANTAEPLDSDNSGEQTQEPANKETQTTQDGKEQQQENQEQEDAAKKPKFDNLEAALQGYSNLEKKIGEQSNELGQLREKAKELDEIKKSLDAQALQEANSKGFDTVKEFENHKEVIKAEADAYAKRIQECEFPEEMVNLLAEYRKNPSIELRQTIESQFSTDTLKDVAGEMAILRGQLQQKENEALQEQLETSAKAYLDENVNKYAEEFKNPAFAKLYGEAFRAYGCDLNTELFVQIMHEFKDYVLKEAGIKTEIENQNNSETDEIEGLTNMGGSSPQTISGNILTMGEKEMAAAIKQLI